MGRAPTHGLNGGIARSASGPSPALVGIPVAATRPPLACRAGLPMRDSDARAIARLGQEEGVPRRRRREGSPRLQSRQTRTPNPLLAAAPGGANERECPGRQCDCRRGLPKTRSGTGADPPGTTPGGGRVTRTSGGNSWEMKSGRHYARAERAGWPGRRGTPAGPRGLTTRTSGRGRAWPSTPESYSYALE